MSYGMDDGINPEKISDDAVETLAFAWGGGGGGARRGRFADACVVERVGFRGCSVMVWGGIFIV